MWSVGMERGEKYLRLYIFLEITRALQLNSCKNTSF